MVANVFDLAQGGDRAVQIGVRSGHRHRRTPEQRCRRGHSRRPGYRSEARRYSAPLNSPIPAPGLPRPLRACRVRQNLDAAGHRKSLNSVIAREIGRGTEHGGPSRQRRVFDRGHPGRARGTDRRRRSGGVAGPDRSRRPLGCGARGRVRRYRDEPGLHLSGVLQPRARTGIRAGKRARRVVADRVGADLGRRPQIRSVDHARG